MEEQYAGTRVTLNCPMQSCMRTTRQGLGRKCVRETPGNKIEEGLTSDNKESEPQQHFQVQDEKEEHVNSPSGQDDM